VTRNDFITLGRFALRIDAGRLCWRCARCGYPNGWEIEGEDAVTLADVAASALEHGRRCSA
jgi:hypothetical protein